MDKRERGYLVLEKHARNARTWVSADGKTRISEVVQKDYNKLLEAIQNHGKGTSKFCTTQSDRHLRPSPHRVRACYADAAFQDHGMTRKELTFAGYWPTFQVLQAVLLSCVRTTHGRSVGG
mmetsp:Transcript_28086/g.43856  ORF Transcript_28086/g.43856 Transcript_28086/m.43856 type:complete len:121 (+) Transcript_28086:231-593(+)